MAGTAGGAGGDLATIGEAPALGDGEGEVACSTLGGAAAVGLGEPRGCTGHGVPPLGAAAGGAWALAGGRVAGGEG